MSVGGHEKRRGKGEEGEKEEKGGEEVRGRGGEGGKEGKGKE